MFLFLVFLSVFQTEIEINGAQLLITADNTRKEAKIDKIINFEQKIVTNSIIIPPFIIYNENNYSIVKIGEDLLLKYSPNSIILPETVSFLSKRSFSSKNIENVDLSQTKIVEIPDECFYKSFSLSNVFLPQNLKIIGSKSFYKCGISSLEFPETLETIKTKAFAKSYLKNVDIQATKIKKLETETFSFCSLLKDFLLPKMLVTIEKDVFLHSAIENIEVPSSVTDIKEGAFEMLSFLETADLSCLKIDSISISCFKNCVSLKSVKFPPKIKVIKEYAFCSTDLTSLEFPDFLETLEQSSFENCNSLESIIMGKKLSKIGKNAFKNCLSLERIVFNKINCQILENAFQSTDLLNLEIPNNVKHIGAEAFKDCTNLESADLSKTDLRKLESSLFDGCFSLKEIFLPTKLTELGDRSLSYIRIKHFDGSPSLFLLGKMCFASSSFLETVDLSKTKIKSIPDGAFMKCKSLKSIIFNNLINLFGCEAFKGCSALQKLEIPKDTELLSNATFYKTGFNNLDLSFLEVKTIASYLFGKCSALESIILPKTITCIEEGAFYGCIALKSINIPQNVNEIQKRAFRECKSLFEVDWSNLTINKINDEMFYNCFNLETFVFPKNVKIIGNEVFCKTLLCDLYIQPSIESVSNASFKGMNALILIDFSKSFVTKIYTNTFSECTNLTFIYLPSILEEVQERAFSDCINLEFVIYCGEKTFPDIPLFGTKAVVITQMSYRNRTFGEIIVSRIDSCANLEYINTNIKENLNPQEKIKKWNQVIDEMREEKLEKQTESPTPTPNIKDKNDKNEQEKTWIDPEDKPLFYFVSCFLVFSLLLFLYAVKNEKRWIRNSTIHQHMY